jgi:hypothetical protein
MDVGHYSVNISITARIRNVDATSQARYLLQPKTAG